jgi:C-terminal processing protease CtpA/Prc
LLKLNAFNPYKHKTRKFYRTLFRSLDEQNTEHLVIDVRDNLGGSITNANNILRHILDEDFVIILERYRAPTFKYSNCSSRIGYVLFSIKRSLELRKKYKVGDIKIAEFKTRSARKNNFDGQVYVITNGYSASSSSYLASLLKEKENAMIIGEESGGGAAGNNGLYYTTVQLPNSKIQVRVPYYWLDYQLIPDKGRGVMPDVPIRYDIEDFKDKKDLEMEWLKKRLQIDE